MSGKPGTGKKYLSFMDGRRFEYIGEAKGCNVTHRLYRSVNGNYIISFTNLEERINALEAPQKAMTYEKTRKKNKVSNAARRKRRLSAKAEREGRHNKGSKAQSGQLFV